MTDENGEVLKAHRGSYKTAAVLLMQTGIDINDIADPKTNICPECEGAGCPQCGNSGQVFE